MRRLWAILLVMVAVAMLAACAEEQREKPGITKLKGVEIREYRGERLDSVNDFRENSIKGPQYIDRDKYRLEVKGLVDSAKTYTYSEITSGFPSFEKVVKLDCVEGWSVKLLWQGVLVRDVLDASGVKNSAESVIFTAQDGYTTSFPVSYFYDKDILLAYYMNGVEIPPERGFPLMLVAEDKWGYKWCKWIVSMELSAEADPGGYWEDRGYSNSGDRSKPFYP